MGDQETVQPSRNVPVNIEEEMKGSYLAYAMSVIVGRALPDVRDGLSPCIAEFSTGCTNSG